MTGPVWISLRPDEKEPDPAVWGTYLEKIFLLHSEQRRQQDAAFAAEYQRATERLKACPNTE